MNQKNCKKIREIIKESGKLLEGKLPSSPRHPTGRNPYAHIPKVIKTFFGKPYKDLPDDKFSEVVYIIEYCTENPF